MKLNAVKGFITLELEEIEREIMFRLQKVKATLTLITGYVMIYFLW